jgi:hypothetical protein
VTPEAPAWTVVVYVETVGTVPVILARCRVCDMGCSRTAMPVCAAQSAAEALWMAASDALYSLWRRDCPHADAARDGLHAASLTL